LCFNIHLAMGNQPSAWPTEALSKGKDILQALDELNGPGKGKGKGPASTDPFATNFRHADKCQSKSQSERKGKGKGTSTPCVKPDGPLCKEQLQALDELNGTGKGKGKGQACLDSFATNHAERGSFITRVGSMHSSRSFQTDLGSRADSFAAGPSADSFHTRPPTSRIDKRLPIGVSFAGTAETLNTRQQSKGVSTRDPARMPKANSFAAGSTQTGTTAPRPADISTQVVRTGSFVLAPTAAPAKFGPRMDMIRE
jgi:hypothetical protein